MFETLLMLSILALTASLLFQGKPLSGARLDARINIEMLQKQLQETRYKAVQSGQALPFGFSQDILKQLCDGSEIPNFIFYLDGTNSSGAICIKSQKAFTILELDRFTGILKARDIR